MMEGNPWGLHFSSHSFPLLSVFICPQCSASVWIILDLAERKGWCQVEQLKLFFANGPQLMLLTVL